MNHPAKKSERVQVANSRNDAKSVQQDLRPSLDIPPVVTRLLADHPRMKGQTAQDFNDLFTAIAMEVQATSMMDFLAVLDATAATFEVLNLRKMKVVVIERMREARRQKLAYNECVTLSIQKGIADFQRGGYGKFMEGVEDDKLMERHNMYVLYRGEIVPPENAPPFHGAYSRGDLIKFERSLDSEADDAQAFLDSMEALDRINCMIDIAEYRREQAFEKMDKWRRKFNERLRDASNRIIEGTVNKRRGDQE